MISMYSGTKLFSCTKEETVVYAMRSRFYANVYKLNAYPHYVKHNVRENMKTHVICTMYSHTYIQLKLTRAYIQSLTQLNACWFISAI